MTDIGRGQFRAMSGNCATAFRRSGFGILLVLRREARHETSPPPSSLHLAAGAAALSTVPLRFAWRASLSDRGRCTWIVAVSRLAARTDIVARLDGLSRCPSGSASQSSSRTGRAPAPMSPPRRSCARPPDGYTLLEFLMHPSRDQRDALRKAQFQFRPRHHAGRGRRPHAPTSWRCILSVPAKTVPEFIAYAKSQPRQDQHGVRPASETGAPCGRARLFEVMTGYQHGRTCPIAASAPALADLTRVARRKSSSRRTA